MTPVPALSNVYCRSPEATCATVSGHGVILDCVRGHYYELDPVALYVWEALDGATTGTRAVEQVITEFEVDPETARADVSRFLQELLHAGLIEPA